MGTTAQKLEYLGTTKSQLKTMINYGLDDDNKITSSTTFRNYVISLKEAFLEALRDSNTLFTNLPKKTGSGSNITLNGTAYAPMRLTLETNTTTQASTPTPSSPQEVKTVTGTQEIKAVGKNLLTTNYFRDVATLTINDTATNDFTYYGCWGTDLINNSNLLKILKPSTTYTISFKFKVIERPNSFGQYNTPSICILYGGSPTISFQDERKNTAPLNTWISTSATFTMPSSLSGYRFLAYNFKDPDNTTTGKIQISEMQIEENNEATSFSPYQEQVSEINLGNIELCKIGTYQDKIFKNSGKNLLDISKIEIGKTWSGVANTQRATILWLPIKANQQYNFVSFWTNSSITNIRVVLNHGSNDQTNNLVVSSFPFTNTTWEYASVEILANTTFTETMLQNVYVMLCEGTNTEYEPYGSGEWYLKKAIGKKILNGSENWVDSGYNASAHHYTYQGANKMGGQTNLISNKFVTSTVGTLVYSCVGNASNTNITLKMPLDISTVAQMKTWLGSNITTVYFVLATPTYEKLNDTLQEELENTCYGMLSYKGQTNIMVESNILPFIVNAVAIEQ